MHVYDTIFGVNDAVWKLEQNKVKKFDQRPRKVLSTTTCLHFNGGKVFMDSHREVLIDMKDHAIRIELLPSTCYTFEQCLTARTKRT